MSRRSVRRAEPSCRLWPNGRKEEDIFPEFLGFVCEYEESEFLIDCTVKLFLERMAGFDRLYYCSEYESGPTDFTDHVEGGDLTRAPIAAVAPALGTEAAAARRMLDALWRSQIAYAQPRRYLAGDLVSRRTFSRIRRKLLAEREEAVAQAETERGAELIRVAEELGLHPEPAGAGPHAWYINCPTGRGHRALAQSQSNQWGCGYCRIDGGPEALRAEVAKRQLAVGGRPAGA